MLLSSVSLAGYGRGYLTRMHVNMVHIMNTYLAAATHQGNVNTATNDHDGRFALTIRIGGALLGRSNT